MKRFAAICIGIALFATACHVLPDEEGQDRRKGGLVLGIASFSDDFAAIKSATLPDTNSFILTVAGLQGTVYYTACTETGPTLSYCPKAPIILSWCPPTILSPPSNRPSGVLRSRLT